MESLMNRFWWNAKNGGGKGMHWLSWSRMCMPKQYGGFGFKRLHEFIVALLAKQGWRILSRPDSTMARLFKAWYFQKCSFLDASIGPNPSYCWRSILAGQTIFRNGCYCRIGIGRHTRIWGDPWLPDNDNPYPITSRSEHHRTATVSALVDPVSNTWALPLLDELFCARDVRLIKQLPLSPAYEDEWSWRNDVRGLYSIKHGYRLATGATNNDVSTFTAWDSKWKLRIPPKYLNFLWSLNRKTLCTSERLPLHDRLLE
ncbi:PREDICTED: uncharacterized protein LOC109184716 [Ipomoea nil]|uniref:uncharacterized protein LOC109184716 n=1 Tax=Ipomoea nil TaxID=35883 RepID=UPI0009017638|nr:PREDICTED: uncharacterized protein LOC109184716 [Ipomoea nil]